MYRCAEPRSSCTSMHMPGYGRRHGDFMWIYVRCMYVCAWMYECLLLRALSNPSARLIGQRLLAPSSCARGVYIWELNHRGIGDGGSCMKLAPLAPMWAPYSERRSPRRCHPTAAGAACLTQTHPHSRPLAASRYLVRTYGASDTGGKNIPPYYCLACVPRVSL